MENSALSQHKCPQEIRRIVVGLSGGVDSSVAAFLLKEGGHEVEGVSLRLWPGASVVEAQKLAELLGISFGVVEAGEAFRRQVVEPFVEAYRRGQTPNPCILCNRFLKFGMLLDYARGRGAKLATGHYARTVQTEGGLRLQQARSRAKDQSYFLFNLKEEVLGELLFPLGNYSKEEVRALAQARGLPTAAKPDSMEACFVPPEGYAHFLEREGVVGVPGEIVDTGGKILGKHTGLHRFTIGQRRGLGDLGKPTPQYVLRLEVESNRLVVGEKEEAFSKRFFLHSPSWVDDTPPLHRRLRICVRYRHAGAMGKLLREADAWAIELEEPICAIAPGQAAVFYEGEVLIGGGWIVG
ncbi:MAG: tRNA 2-thiouridine(34) synthase MnmA [Proteobacteria bacterium]|nr:tRNA 2-thiouridine(34) synthase MnmA [Pseudomonadota bacterium]